MTKIVLDLDNEFRTVNLHRLAAHNSIKSSTSSMDINR